jgi:RNA-directed DNA polymerase
MSLTTPLSVQKLQTALHDKAKGSPNFRFYALYDKVYREEVMAFAYECCQANGGAAGVDGQTFEDIEEYGVKNWLDELRQELKSRTYRPQPRSARCSATCTCVDSCWDGRSSGTGSVLLHTSSIMRMTW